MPKVTASSGDSVTSIAEPNGFRWQTVWAHPDHSERKSKRKDPNIIAPGDEVFIPDLTARHESRATESTHKFKRKGVPAMLKLRLTDVGGKPRKNEDYTLVIDGKIFTGKTDGDGKIEKE